MNNLSNHNGYWWFPDDPEHQFAGRLTVENDAACLHLTINKELPSVSLQQAQDYDCIYGRTSKGKLVSLLRCFDLNKVWSSSGIESRKIFVNYVIIGGHIPPPNSGQALFRKMHLTWPSLLSWFVHTGVNVDIDHGHFGNFVISFTQREPIEVICGDGLKIIFTFHSDGIPLGAGFPGKIHFEEVVTVTVVPLSPQNLDGFLGLLCELQHFFSICMLEFSSPDSISLVGAFDANDGIDSPKEQRLKLHLAPVVQKKYLRDPHPTDMLLTFKHAQSRFSSMIDKWHTMAPDLLPMRSLYFSSLYGPNRYIHSSFLSLAQAIEVFHRRVKGGTYLASDLYRDTVQDPLLAALPDNLDQTIKQIFSQRLAFLNEYSLKKRIMELAESHLSVVTHYVPDWKKVSRAIVEARNHLTHYAESEDRSNPEVDNLDLYRSLVRMLLELAVLEEVGADVTVLHTQALDSWTYRRIFPARSA